MSNMTSTKLKVVPMAKGESHKLRTLDLAYIGMFVALTAICSQIQIPLSVPFTLQTFAVLITVSLLGTGRGLAAVLIYILLGTIGVPVFAGFTGGYGILLGNTGGYIVGFIFTALVTGVIQKLFGKKLPVMIISMVLGILVCYVFGTVWFILFYTRTEGAISIMTALAWCVFPFIIPDLCKIALAIFLDKRLAGLMK